MTMVSSASNARITCVGQPGAVVDDAADHAQDCGRAGPALSRRLAGTQCGERALDALMHGAELTIQLGLIVVAEEATLPPVEPAGLTVRQCGVGQRRHEPAQFAARVVGVGGVGASR